MEILLRYEVQYAFKCLICFIGQEFLNLTTFLLKMMSPYKYGGHVFHVKAEGKYSYKLYIELAWRRKRFQN